VGGGHGDVGAEDLRLGHPHLANGEGENPWENLHRKPMVLTKMGGNRFQQNSQENQSISGSGMMGWDDINGIAVVCSI